VQERGIVAALTAIRARLVVYALAAIAVVADVLVTSLALHHIHQDQHVWGPFGLSLSFNSGFAFSLFSGRALAVSVLLCFGVAVLAFVVGRARTVPQSIGGGLVLGGALGNLGERLFGGHHGRVPDFITLTHWPTFNVADACISVGAVVLIASLLFARPPAATTAATP
jgi:signal peptidase II